jgi:hypothetical protein
MRIIQGPKIESSSIFGKIKAAGQTFLRTPAFEKVQQSWINGDGAAAAVGLILTDDDKAAIQGRIQIVGAEYSGYEPTEILKYKEDAAGAYIIEKLINENLVDVNSMSEKTKQTLINSAKRDSKIKKTLATKFGYEIVGGRRTRKARKARKARKTRKAKNKRRSQRNRK